MQCGCLDGEVTGSYGVAFVVSYLLTRYKDWGLERLEGMDSSLGLSLSVSSSDTFPGLSC